MKFKWVPAACAAAAAVLAAPAVQAFECPKHFAEAQALIDKVGKDLSDMEGQMSKAEHALVHALLDDAKMLLAGGRHNHQKPQGAYDHARAVAKADAALGSARAADMLNAHYMK